MSDIGRATVTEAAANITVRERLDIEEWELRKTITTSIMNRFVTVNVSVLIIIAIIYIIDLFYIFHKVITPADRVITSNIIIAIIGATTVQFGAIAFAISQWLFPKK